MPPDVQTLVVVATYNEMENLPRLIEAVHRHLPCADALVIDDNSPDGTGQWCERKTAEDQRLRCLRREGKLGLGTALIAGMQYAIEHGYRYAITMDADFSHAPEVLPELVGRMDPAGGPGVDVMIGSRYVPGGSIEGWPLKRHLMSRGVNLYVRWFLGLEPRDCSSGLRCYRTELLARLDFHAIRSKGYAFEEEVLWRLKRLGARFGEVPIHFVNRRQGASKINAGVTLTAMRVLGRLTVENMGIRGQGSGDRGPGPGTENE